MEKHTNDWCYLTKSGTTLDYDFDSKANQDVKLRRNEYYQIGGREL